MTLVIDASIAAKWFVEEPGRAQALEVLDETDRQAPDLVVAEVANVIWKKVLRIEMLLRLGTERMANESSFSSQKKEKSRRAAMPPRD